MGYGKMWSPIVFILWEKIVGQEHLLICFPLSRAGGMGVIVSNRWFTLSLKLWNIWVLGVLKCYNHCARIFAKEYNTYNAEGIWEGMLKMSSSR